VRLKPRHRRATMSFASLAEASHDEQAAQNDVQRAI
jgi:hypothetical protein